MAITVLGGLLTSSILTLGVLPAVARRLSSSSVSGPA
jgi:Cu/Ag efflux pump CusA